MPRAVRARCGWLRVPGGVCMHAPCSPMRIPCRATVVPTLTQSSSAGKTNLLPSSNATSSLCMQHGMRVHVMCTPCTPWQPCAAVQHHDQRLHAACTQVAPSEMCHAALCGPSAMHPCMQPWHPDLTLAPFRNLISTGTRPETSVPDVLAADEPWSLLQHRSASRGRQGELCCSAMLVASRNIVFVY